MSELRKTVRPKHQPAAAGQPNARPRRAAGAPARQSCGGPSSREKSPVPASAGAGQTPRRRTRGTAPASRGKAPKTRGGEPSRKRKLAAASDDASGLTGMEAASSAATPPARTACAAAAQSRREGATPGTVRYRATPRVPGDALHRTVQGDAEHIPGSETPLPQDGAAFAEALHARIDLLKVSERLLRSEDEKVAQRELDLRLNFRYPKGSAAEENVEIVFDVPRPDQPDS